MVKKLFAGSFALAAFFAASAAFAQTTATTTQPVIFPIIELGSCNSKDACRVYCDDAAHKDACFAYAQTHGLMRKDEVEKARAFLKERVASSTLPRIDKKIGSSTIEQILATKSGPGGCTTREACKAFCEDKVNSATCLQFAKDNNLMTPEQIALAKKLQSQVGPGGCKGEECKKYCEDVSHEQVCLEFAKTNGFISKDEAAKRIMKMGSTTREITPEDLKRLQLNASTTLPKPKLNDRPASSTKPLPGTNASGTKPIINKDSPKPPLPPQATTSATINSGRSAEPNIDYSKPPYHCTPAQADEGACDPDQFPGYVAPSGSEQGGSIFFGILHFFGLR